MSVTYMAHYCKKNLSHLAGKGSKATTENEKRLSIRTVSDMEAENTEGGEEASKGKTSTFSVSTILEKCNKTVVEEESNVDTESRKEDITLE